MKCDNCEREMASVIRINKTGQSGIFWCRECLYGEKEEDPPGSQPMCRTCQAIAWAMLEQSIHSSLTKECCPDFSCCNPENKWPEDKCKKFLYCWLEGDNETMMIMLMGALKGITDNEKSEVFIGA